MLRLLCGFTVVLALAVPPVYARLVRIVVDSRQDVLGGKTFGVAGSYEKLRGTLYFAVDPANPANQIITDINKAPRNALGEVEFSADFSLLKPKRIERGNGALLAGIANRGRPLMLSFFNRASRSLDPASEAEFGDGFLFHEGYTLLWVGWQFDPPREAGLLRLYPAVARDDGRPIRGLVRSNFVVAEQTADHSLADRNHVAYAVADPAAPENVLTVRGSVEANPETISRAQWKFARLEAGQVVTDPTRVYLEGGFEPGKIYEVAYVAENPPLVGLGPAAVRDAVSFLKSESSHALAIPKGAIDRAVGFGISQSGRFLRTFLYYGFNRDESGRPALDGVMAHVAGGGRGSFNHRFAQPSRDAHPYLNFFYPTDIFPFTDLEQSDPESGLSDGLQSHSLPPELRPKTFYTNSSYEYWGRAASLIHTTIDGQRDAPLPENVRIYLMAGSQHGPASFPPRTTIGQQPDNPMEFVWAMRALLKAMDRWIAAGAEPPPSRYPRLDQETLVSPERLGFPKLPGVAFSSRIHKAYRADYGPEFISKGIVAHQPPKIGPAFPVMVAAVDADGNETAGIRLPELSVPLATYTGWNLFNARSGPSDEISSMAGSYLPFPRTKRERRRNKDPRRSIEERYESRDAYLGLVAEAALELAEQGYLLDADVPAILRGAQRHWDHLLAAGDSVSQKRSPSR